MGKIKKNKRLPIYHSMRTAGLSSFHQLTDSTSGVLFSVEDTDTGSTVYVTGTFPPSFFEKHKEADKKP